MENQTEKEADKPESAGSPETSGDCCEAGLERVREWSRRTEDYVKREPAKAVGAAVGLGLFLAIFPVFSVLGGLARVLVSLLRPLLLVLGAVKLYEEYEKRQGGGPGSAPEGDPEGDPEGGPEEGQDGGQSPSDTP